MQSNVLVFSNPGSIDVRAITTMGVNAKPSGGIGRFGTGLKYAIAGILRLGGSIAIYQTGYAYHFRSQEEEINGQLFGIVYMDTVGCNSVGEERLGFTTDLGKHWQPWMLLRELWSNARDEGGTAGEFARDDLTTSWPKESVHIVADSTELLVAWEARDGWLLPPTAPLLTDPINGIAIRPKAEGILFAYQEILVAGDTENVVSGFTYSLLGPQQLTEDRTLVSLGAQVLNVALAWLTCTDEALLQEFFALPEGMLEKTLDYDWHEVSVSSEFLNIAMQNWKECPESIKAVLRRKREEVARLLGVPDTWEEMLEAEPLVRSNEGPWYSAFGMLHDLEKQTEEEKKRADYWKNCARKLAGRIEDAELG